MTERHPALRDLEQLDPSDLADRIAEVWDVVPGQPTEFQDAK